MALLAVHTSRFHDSCKQLRPPYFPLNRRPAPVALSSVRELHLASIRELVETSPTTGLQERKATGKLAMVLSAAERECLLDMQLIAGAQRNTESETRSRLLMFRPRMPPMCVVPTLVFRRTVSDGDKGPEQIAARYRSAIGERLRLRQVLAMFGQIYASQDSLSVRCDTA